MMRLLHLLGTAAAIGTIYLVSRRGTISAKHFSRPEPTAFVRPKRKKKKGKR